MILSQVDSTYPNLTRTSPSVKDTLMAEEVRAVVIDITIIDRV